MLDAGLSLPRHRKKFDIDRLREGKKTACEVTCQAGAIFVGSPEEIAENRSKRAVERIAGGMMD